MTIIGFNNEDLWDWWINKNFGVIKSCLKKG